MLTISAKDGQFKVSGVAEDLRFLHRKFVLGYGGYMFRVRHNQGYLGSHIFNQEPRYKSTNLDGVKNWIADLTANEQTGLTLPIFPAYLNTQTKSSNGKVHVTGGSDEYLIANLDHFTKGGKSRIFILDLNFLV